MTAYWIVLPAVQRLGFRTRLAPCLIMACCYICAYGLFEGADRVDGASGSHWLNAADHAEVKSGAVPFWFGALEPSAEVGRGLLALMRSRALMPWYLHELLGGMQHLVPLIRKCVGSRAGRISLGSYLRAELRCGSG